MRDARSQTTNSATKARRAIVIGGSLGGLFAGNMLRSVGWNVDIFERSAGDLDSRGGGIVLQPDVVEVFRRSQATLDKSVLGVQSRYRTVFRPDGSIESKHIAPQTQTSWSLIYTTLKAAFGEEHYHRAKTLLRVEQDEAQRNVTAIFDDNTREVGDLLIGADGGNSTVRRQYWPHMQPRYAGYIAWRGLLAEDRMSPVSRDTLHGDFGFANNKGSHILGYLVPGADNDVRPGHRIYNWVWYRVVDEKMLAEVMTDRDGKSRGYAIPEGLLAERWVDHVHREAQNLLPPGFRDVVQATPQPFAQAIRDLASDRMVSGRAIILGDAASIPRPHTAASTLKAAANAIALADELAASPDDVDAALAQWEPPQVMYGKYLEKQGVETGNYLLFRNSARQVSG
ncbi:FAD binding domain-containing protein [Mesorhizobium sp. B2-4-17]|uniref:FAD binding domain-containing protein n=1 Tax=Mesorhizobium sp. B2-4-17 TaxID=2589932 RepID=UPI00112ECE63|nr:FAD binding domain-containing protein [Mesorhizobium sp. B2-4-17]TPK75284.1 2-polyprenyl-6-methoxyphenol hydroxylase [Mesorhizobium sp. B2-4-17]